MKRIIRSVRPTMSAAVILCAFAGALPGGDTSAAPNSQRIRRAEQQGPPSK